MIPANYYNEYVLLARTMQQQKVRPKAIYSVLGGAASSYKFVKEFPEAAQYIMDCNHWFDPKNPKALELKKKVEAKGEFYTYEVYMNYSSVLLLADALENAPRAPTAPKIIAALESLDLRGPRDALRPDQVRQRAEPGRRAGEHAGARQRHPGDLPGGVRVGEAGVPDAGVSVRERSESARPREARGPSRRDLDGRLRGHAADARAMLSPIILVPAILNGLLTGAVYALVALGLTLIYGVLHIINFAHGALLTAAMFAAFFAHKLLGLDPYLAAIGLTPLFFCLGYALQRFVIGPAAHGEDRNILLVTLGLAVVIENALLYAFRADTRTINLSYGFNVVEVGAGVPQRCRA